MFDDRRITYICSKNSLVMQDSFGATWDTRFLAPHFCLSVCIHPPKNNNFKTRNPTPNLVISTNLANCSQAAQPCNTRKLSPLYPRIPTQVDAQVTINHHQITITCWSNLANKGSLDDPARPPVATPRGSNIHLRFEDGGNWTNAAPQLVAYLPPL
jgi:hypothetical protein